MRTIVTVGALGVMMAACGPAVERLSPGLLGVSARDAQLEARTTAASWDAGARLRWVEGIEIAPSGLALPGGGHWRFHYTAPGRTQGLVVAVAALETATQEGAPVSPPGVAIGAAALPSTWVDSPEVLSAVLSARGGVAPEQASLALVPGERAQWVVTFPEVAPGRQWRVDAATGEVVGS